MRKPPTAKRPSIRGSGKGGGGAPLAPKEEANDLRSKSYARVLDLLGWGEWDGLVREVPGTVKVCSTIEGNAHINCITTGLTVGQTVSGPGIQIGTTIVAIDGSGVFFTVDLPPVLTSTDINLWFDASSGAESIFLDDTPLQSFVDSAWVSNFTGVKWAFTPGTQDQGHLPGFDTVENYVSVAVKIRNIAPVTRTVTNSDADKLIVEVRIPALYQRQTTGDVIKSTVNLKLYVKLNGGSFELVKDWVIYGKCVTDYLESTEFTLPKSTTPDSDSWEVKLERVTADHDGNSLLADTAFFNAYTEVVTRKFRYPNMCLSALEVDAQNFSKIPTRAFRVRMRKIQVPTNYDPETRTYATSGPGTTGGGWDGTFKVAYCNNPAWVTRDICINQNFGLGRHIDVTKLDKWTLYDIAQYCDVLVPDGKGGTEPRFVANFYLQTQAEALKVLSDVSSIARMMVYYGKGTINFVQDRPKDSFTAFTNSDVKDGTFNYPSTGKRARKGVIYVRFNDPDDFYRPKIQPYEDYETIFRYGYNELEVTAFGTCSRGQAYRYGANIANTERLEYEGVSFVATVRGHLIKPGMIIDFLDERRQQIENGGKIMSTADTSTVTLDKPVLIEPAKTYSLLLVVPKAIAEPTDITNSTQTVTIDASQTETKTVNTVPGTVSTLTVTVPFTSVPIGATWILTSNTLAAQKMRVMAVEEISPTEFQISGNRYVVSKFDETEVDPNFELPPVLYYPTDNYVPPVESLSLIPRTVVVPEGVSTWLDVGWSSPTTYRYYASFRVSYSYEGGPFQNLPEVFSPGTTFKMEVPGRYFVRVTAVSSINSATSIPAQDYYDFANANPTNRFRITGLELTNQGNDYVFSGRDARFSWRLNSPSQTQEMGSETNGAQDGINDPYFNHFLVRVLNEDRAVVFEDRTMNPHYIYSFEQNLLHGTTSLPAPYRQFTVQVFAIDRYNTQGVPSELTVNNPTPSLPTLTTQALLGAVNFKFSFPSDTDFRGYKIWASLTNGFTPADANLVYDGPDSQPTIKLDAGLTWYYKYGAYDAFGTTGMLVSSQASVVPLLVLDTVAPSTPSGLVLTSVLVQNVDGSQAVRLTATWTANAESDFDKYHLRWKEVAGGPFDWNYTTASGVSAIQAVLGDGKFNTAYEVQIAASDRDSNLSAYSASATVTSATDTTLPSNPTSITVTAGIRMLVLAWTNAADDDLAAVDIYKATVNVFGSSTLLVSERATKNQKGSYVDTAVVQGTTYYYFFKSRDTSGNVTASPTASVNAAPGTAVTADLADFAVSLTKQYTNTVAPSGDSWTDNSPGAGRIAWNAHTLYYRGVAYAISAGNTASSAVRYVYWDSGSPTVYQTSTTNPTLTDTQFIIATNLNGAHDLAWNAMANILVKSAYIESVVADKIDAGTIEAKTILIGSAGNTTNSIIQSYNFSSGSAGWRIRGDGNIEGNDVTLRGAAVVLGKVAPTSGAGLYLGSDKMGYFNGTTWLTYTDSSGRFYLGGTSGSLQWDGATLIVTGAIQAASTINGSSASTVATGGVRAASGLDSSNRLITAVLPATTVGTPGSNGLYLGSDFMGYYNSGWKTYMDNSGNFYLGGTSGALTWNSGTSTLTIQGTSIFKGTVDVSSGGTRAYIDSTMFAYGDQSSLHARINRFSATEYAFAFYNGATLGPYFSRSSAGGGQTFLAMGAGSQISMGTGGPTLTNASGTGQIAVGSNIVIQNGLGIQLTSTEAFSIAGTSTFNGTVNHTSTSSFSGTTNFNGTVNVSSTNKIEFTGAGGGAFLDEDWGVNINGDSSHPLQVPNASIAVGFNSGGSNLSTGRIYFGGTGVYLYVSSGQLFLNDGNGDRALT